MRTEVTLDTESLPPEEGKKLEEMIESSGFFDMPAKFAPPNRGADYFQYRITAKSKEKEHTVELSDPQVPEKLRMFLKSIIKYAKK